MKKIENVLFVCTGNSCRSVMAEGLLKKMLNDTAKHYIMVSSAGVSAIEGFAPTDNTITVMKKEGIDVSGYKTTKLTPQAINNADLVLVMDNIHKDDVIDLVPEAKDKTFLLKEYVNIKDEPSGFIIPDPIGRPLEVYERVFDTIKMAIEELIKRL